MAHINLSDMFTRKVLYSALRSLSGSGSAARPFLTAGQLASLSTFDQPAAATVEENAYYQKYKEKLEKFKESKPEEYESALKKLYGDKSAEATDAPDVNHSSMLSAMQSTSKSDQRGEAPSVNSPQRKTLDSIIKLELLHDKSPSEISQIWNQHYAKKEKTVFATIPLEKYNRLKIKGKELPLFIYPIPRESGYEFMLGQCFGDDWYYTSLIAYQTHVEFAPFSLAVHHYTELVDTKGIVLMVGEIASDDLKPEFATLLVHQTQLMYGSDENLELVRRMHEKPDSFEHMDVIDACKKASLF